MGVLRYLFRSTGRLYLVAALLGTLFATHVLVFASTALLASWVDLTGPEFGRIVAVSQGFVLIESTLTFIFSWRSLKPARRWCAGRRDDSGEAWRALLTLPRVQVRRTQVLATVITIAPVSAYIAYEVGESFVGFLALAGASYVTLLYGVVWRVLMLELLLRPGVEATSRGLTERVAGRSGGVPLRLKLLAVIPLSNVGTGVAIAGLSSDGESGLGELGLDVAFAVGFAFTVSLALAVLLAGSILSPLRELTKATRRVAADNLDERVPVTSTDETGELTESFNEMVKAVGERERLREAFGAFVDPGLTERVLEEGTDLEGEEVEVSILFLDVRGFTSFSEETDANDVVTELNELFEAAVPCVHDHGGHVDKFVGDGLIAVFGAPERMPDHAIRAVEAARCIAERLGSASNMRLQVGVGVNSGRVIAGTVGGGGRLDFTVIGDAVNTAARVEALTRKTGEDVLITGATHAALDGAGAYWEELPEAELPGKRSPVKVFAPRAGG